MSAIERFAVQLVGYQDVVDGKPGQRQVLNVVFLVRTVEAAMIEPVGPDIRSRRFDPGVGKHLAQ